LSLFCLPAMLRIREMFIALSYAAGEAQRNLGEAIVVIPDVELTATFRHAHYQSFSLRREAVACHNICIGRRTSHYVHFEEEFKVHERLIRCVITVL
jgi:hypothetical protein